MVDVQFYHLLTTPLDAALPKLVATAYARNLRVCIIADDAQCEQLDKHLWTFNPASFLPHGPTTDAQAARYPVTLATRPDVINQPDIYMVTNSLLIDTNACNVNRIFDLFDGHDTQQVSQARERWKHYDNATLPLKYIRQNDAGGWDVVKQVHQPG